MLETFSLFADFLIYRENDLQLQPCCDFHLNKKDKIQDVLAESLSIQLCFQITASERQLLNCWYVPLNCLFLS